MKPRKAAFSMWTAALIQIIGTIVAGMWLIDGATPWDISLASFAGWGLLMVVLWVESTRERE